MSNVGPQQQPQSTAVSQGTPAQGHASQGYPPGPPQKRGPSAATAALIVLGGVMVLGAGSCVVCVAVGANRAPATADSSAAANAVQIANVVPRPSLPPEPPPPFANLASEVPGLEAKLAKDQAFAAVWTGPRADLDLFLTWVSELLASSGAAPNIADPLKAKHLQDAGAKLFMVFVRQGSFPAGFTDQLRQHLAATKSEPHLGVWAPWTKGAPVHDYSALAAWLNREDPTYFREHLAAKREGPAPWGDVGDKNPPARPYLVNELDALNWLALLTNLSPDEEARRAALVQQAKQPKLGQAFKLGDFTYTVKGVTTYAAIGTAFAEKRASDGARFVVVTYAIRNEGNETATVLTDDFRIIDAQGREFRPSSDGNTALAMSGSKDLLASELQPGIARNMATAFEMPETAAAGTFTLVIPEKGLLGTESVRITLR